MSAENPPQDDYQAITKQRTEIAKGLTLAAAQARFTNRRARYEAGYADRIRARSDRIIGFVLLVAIVLIPNALSISYFGFFASDQYVVETRLLVRPNRGLGAISGGADALAEIEVERETQVVTDFLTGATLAERLRNEGVFARLYQYPQLSFDALQQGAIHPDPIAGLSPDASAEDIADYWEDMATAEIEVSVGVIVFTVKSFSADGALEVANRSIKAADDLLSSMNATAWTDATVRSEAVLTEATRRLVVAQNRMTALRDATGSIDVETEAGVATTLGGRLRETLASLERDYSSQAGVLDEDAPLLKALQRQIETLRVQIKKVEEDMTLSQGQVGFGSVSSRIARFAAAEVEADAAQAQFIEATATFERTRQVAELRSSFLDIVTPPRAPQSATRPRRGLWIAGFLVISIFAYWSVLGLITAVKKALA